MVPGPRRQHLLHRSRRLSAKPGGRQDVCLDRNRSVRRRPRELRGRHHRTDIDRCHTSSHARRSNALACQAKQACMARLCFPPARQQMRCIPMPRASNVSLCYYSSVSKYPANDTKFQLVRDLNLPVGQYAITSSGPLGVREIREIGDIDLVVDDDLWNELSSSYPITQEQGVTKIRISHDIEVLGEGSLYNPRETGPPSVAEQIAQADIINGLPFVSLRHVLYFKRRMKRAKDERDVAALERLLDEH